MEETDIPYTSNSRAQFILVYVGLAPIGNAQHWKFLGSGILIHTIMTLLSSPIICLYREAMHFRPRAT